jgi:putative DNA primase/helicase
VDIAVIPEWFVKLASASSQNKKIGSSLNNNETAQIPAGTRNTTLTQSAGALRRFGSSVDEIDNMLQLINTNRCNPPLLASEVTRIAKSITRYKPETELTFTDTDNANRLVEYAGDKIRYCPETKSWWLWNGKYWEVDKSFKMLTFATQTIRNLLANIESVEDKNLRKKSKKELHACLQKGRLTAMVDLAKKDRCISIEKFDLKRMLLNISNGIIDLRNGQLMPHDSIYLNKSFANVAYCPSEQCPRWLNFLSQVMKGDQSLITYLKKVFGYCLTGQTSEQVMFFFCGRGANGKSTLISVLQKLTGTYSCQINADTLLVKNTRGIRNDLARLGTARVACASEADFGEQLSESTIKQITGGDTIVARFLFKEYFEFMPQFKIILAVNHKPKIRGTDHAIWRRIRLIPFEVTIPDEERNPNLLEKLLEELSGILNWAIEGCLEWQQHGLETPEKVRMAVEEYRHESDLIGEFLQERCTIDLNDSSRQVNVSEVYRAYQDWCFGESIEPIKKNLFSKLLYERGHDQVRRTGGEGRGRMYWGGISLAPPPFAVVAAEDFDVDSLL